MPANVSITDVIIYRLKDKEGEDTINPIIIII